METVREKISIQELKKMSAKMYVPRYIFSRCSKTLGMSGCEVVLIKENRNFSSLSRFQHSSLIASVLCSSLIPSVFPEEKCIEGKKIVNKLVIS